MMLLSLDVRYWSRASGLPACCRSVECLGTTGARQTNTAGLGFYVRLATEGRRLRGGALVLEGERTATAAEFIQDNYVQLQALALRPFQHQRAV